MINSKDPISLEHRYLFDLQGFLHLEGVIPQSICRQALDVLYSLELQEHDDSWAKTWNSNNNATGTPMETKYLLENQVRLNSLPKMNPIFDQFIAHPTITPYLREFMGEPQLINTWSITKSKGARNGSWHNGVLPSDYSVHLGNIRSRMLNVVFFLTDNGPEDGCMIAVPGSHKINVPIDGRKYDGMDMPGSVKICGKAGDVFMFSEAVMHTGLAKSSIAPRTNLYYNYAHQHYSVVMKEPHNANHFIFPPEVRERFNSEQREITRWMDYLPAPFQPELVR